MEEKQMSEMDKIMQGWNNDTVIPEVVTRKAEEAFSRIHRECEENSEKSIICGANKGTSTVHRRWKRYVAAFIAVAAVGGTVFADTRLHLAELFPKEMNSPQAQEQIMTDIAVEVTGQVHMPEAYREEGTEDVFGGRKVIPDASPVLSIEEVQYDGTTLYIYGASTENGRKYELNADRLYINDKEYGPVGTTNLNEWTGEDGYTFTTDLSALHLEDDFTVTLPLSIYQGEERFQNQELSFTMSAKANIQKAEDQTFAHDGFTIYVTNIVRTTNVVRFSVRYQLTEEEREKLDETNTGLTSVISGDEVEDGQNGFTSGYEVEDGYVEEHIHAGISPDLDQIALQTLLVENGGYVRDGKVIAEDMIRLNE